MFGGQETTKELDLGIKIVHECFTERDDVASCYECRYRTSNKFLG